MGRPVRPDQSDSRSAGERQYGVCREPAAGRVGGWRAKALAGCDDPPAGQPARFRPPPWP